MFRFYDELSPPSMKNMFKLRAENPDNLRHVSKFSRPMFKSVFHRTESRSKIVGDTARKTKEH